MLLSSQSGPVLGEVKYWNDRCLDYLLNLRLCQKLNNKDNEA